VIYAVSGIAVSRIEDWNPNYVVRTELLENGRRRVTGALAQEVLRRLRSTRRRGQWCGWRGSSQALPRHLTSR
jgi:hypothetical protein